MINKRTYEAPQLTVITFKAEYGYAYSLLQALALSYALRNDGNQSLEDRQDGGNWSNSSDWF